MGLLSDVKASLKKYKDLVANTVRPQTGTIATAGRNWYNSVAQKPVSTITQPVKSYVQTQVQPRVSAIPQAINTRVITPVKTSFQQMNTTLPTVSGIAKPYAYNTQVGSKLLTGIGNAGKLVLNTAKKNLTEFATPTVGEQKLYKGAGWANLNPQEQKEILNKNMNMVLGVSNAPKAVSKVTNILPKSKVMAGLSDQKSALSDDLAKVSAKLKTGLQGIKVGQQKVTGVRPTGVQDAASLKGIISQDPVQKIISALKEAKPARNAQEAIYAKIRSQQAGALSGIGKQMSGEAGFYKKLGQLKGEMPKVQFESVRKQIGQSDINSLFNKVESSSLSLWEKVGAQGGLKKLLGAEGGTVPTRKELELLSEVFPPEFIQSVLNKRPLMQKLLSGAESVLNLPRAIMASTDLSAPLRQGIFFVSRPKQWGPAFGNMFKYAFSEGSYKNLIDDIKLRPNYRLMKEGKLALTDMSPLLASREEAFMSNLAEKIPGFGVVARGSNRAYSGFLNKLRADVFDDLVGKAQKQGVKIEGKALQDLASFINSATGRGNLGATIQKAAPILNATFFSPRLMASRLNLLNPVTYARYDPFVRKEALKSLLGFGGTALTVLGLAKLGGAEVGADPRSADFGKIKVGNTRYDILGGFQQYIRLAGQLLTGQIVSSTTGKTMTLGEGYKPLTRKDIIARFFESKEAPVASFVTALLTGQTGIGEPVNIPAEVLSRVMPLMVQDLYELAKDKDSIGQALAMGLPGIFGVGSQTYGKQELVTGQNRLGQPTSQVRPIQGLPEIITEKTFGKRPLGGSSSWNLETYLEQLKEMPREEAAKKWDLLVSNPDTKKKMAMIVKEQKQGVTIQDKMLKDKGVASGDRAIEIVKNFNKLKTQEEKAKLWKHYVDTGVLTKDVQTQVKQLLSKPQSGIKVGNNLSQAVQGLRVSNKTPGAEAWFGKKEELISPLPKNPQSPSFEQQGWVKQSDGTYTKGKATIGKTVPVKEKIVSSGSYSGLAQKRPVDNISKKIAEVSSKYDVEDSLIAALLWQESGYDPKAINDGGEYGVDRGIAQINSKAHPEISDSQAYDPDFAIEFVAKELKSLLKYFNGDYNRAIAAYNVGRGGASIKGPEKYGGGPKGQKYLDGVAKNLTPELRKKYGLKTTYD